MNIVNVMLWMKRNAYEESTIRKVAKLLRHLKKNCNTKAPEEVKLYIANKTCGNGHKENLVEAYAIYIRSEGLTWEQPFYQRYDKKRRAPKEKLMDFLINNARIEMKLKLSILKDLGLRPIELTWLRIQDIDLSTGIVSITGAKHTVGREGKLKPKTLELLKIYIATKKTKLNKQSIQRQIQQPISKLPTLPKQNSRRIQHARTQANTTIRFQTLQSIQRISPKR